MEHPNIDFKRICLIWTCELFLIIVEQFHKKCLQLFKNFWQSLLKSFKNLTFKAEVLWTWNFNQKLSVSTSISFEWLHKTIFQFLLRLFLFWIRKLSIRKVKLLLIKITIRLSENENQNLSLGPDKMILNLTNIR